jgi:phosphoadenosine phosphosulfate reductase
MTDTENCMATLEDKIIATEKVIVEVLESADPQHVRVAWTGGKDSTVVLFLWRHILQHHRITPVRAINLDTGCKFQEVLAFRDDMAKQWNIDLHIAVPQIELETYPVADDVLSCCRDLKVEPLLRAVRDTETSHLLTGIRRDEHPDRVGRVPFEPRHNPDHVMVNPILEWTEMDIWAFHTRFGLPHCSLYDSGYRSLGCEPCTASPGRGEGERGGRDQKKEESMKQLISMGYF